MRASELPTLHGTLYQLAEQYDVPVGIHMGPGPAGIAYNTGYRSRFSSPLLLEEALVRHPKLRVYIMHAGWPMLDDMVACSMPIQISMLILRLSIGISPKKNFTPT